MTVCERCGEVMTESVITDSIVDPSGRKGHLVEVSTEGYVHMHNVRIAHYDPDD